MEIPLAKPHLVPCHSLMYNEGHLKVCHDSTWAEHFIVFFLSEDPGESFHFLLAAAVELPGFWEVSSGFSCLGLATWSELSSQPTCHTLSGVDPSILMCCCLARVSFAEEMATQLALSCLSSMLNAFSTIVVLKRFFFFFFALCVVRCLHRSEESIRSPGAGVTHGCEPPHVGTGNGTCDPCKSNMCP